MPYRSFFLRKIADLRSRYGDEEAEYFTEHYKCEICPEQRLAALTIHHTDGHKVKAFQTLCFNCHMVLHSPKVGHETYQNHLEWVEEVSLKKKMRFQRNKMISD